MEELLLLAVRSGFVFSIAERAKMTAKRKSRNVDRDETNLVGLSRGKEGRLSSIAWNACLSTKASLVRADKRRRTIKIGRKGGRKGGR